MNEAQLQAAYTSATGQPAGKVEKLPGGAGNRIYWRVHGITGRSAVVMELPADPVKSEEASKDHAPATSSSSSESKPESKSDTKTDTKTETKTETKPDKSA